MPPPAALWRYFDTENEERHPRVQRPLNTISVCSIHDPDSVPWYDSVNHCICSVAGNIRSAKPCTSDAAPEFERFRNPRC
ncbi:hypothetical protein MTO96_022970 [Rhipicephalus appendiculatus]